MLRLLRAFRGQQPVVVVAIVVIGLVAISPVSAEPLAVSVAQAGALSSGSFAAVGCYSNQKCLAVGRSRPTDRSPDQQLADEWNGITRSWHRVQLPTLGFTSYLNGVSCVSSWCLLVGEASTSDPDAGGRLMPTAERWNKSGIVVDTHPLAPSGASYASLTSVNCLSAAFCMAVGWDVRSGIDIPLFERFNGTAWRLLPGPDPPASGVKLAGVACVPRRYQPSSWCHAVGYRGDHGTNQIRVYSWDGVQWMREYKQIPADARSTYLQSVACRMTQCLAVGYRVAWSHQRYPLAETLSLRPKAEPSSSQHVWVQSSVPVPGRGGAIMSAVTWAGPNMAKGAGAYYDLHKKHWQTLIEDWQDKWRLNSPADCFDRCRTRVPNSSLPNSRLVGVSCTAGNSCMSVGVALGEVRGGYETKPLALWLKHTAGYWWEIAPSAPMG